MVGNISENAAMSFAALSISLCLIRVHLYCANAKGLSATTRILGLWVSMIWFTSLDGISIITKRNLVYATVGLVFLISCNDVYHPRFLMTEPLEHLFGDLRTMRREFTVLEFMDMIRKLARRYEAIAKGNLFTSHERNKGYRSTNNEFV